MPFVGSLVYLLVDLFVGPLDIDHTGVRPIVSAIIWPILFQKTVCCLMEAIDWNPFATPAPVCLNSQTVNQMANQKEFSNRLVEFQVFLSQIDFK